MSADVQITEKGIVITQGSADTAETDGFSIRVSGEAHPRVLLNPSGVKAGDGTSVPALIPSAADVSAVIATVAEIETDLGEMNTATAAAQTTANAAAVKANNGSDFASTATTLTNLGGTTAAAALTAAQTAATTAAAARVSSGSAVVAIAAIAALTATDVVVTLSSTMASTAYNAIPFLNLAAADLALGIGVDLRVKSQTTNSVTVSVNNTTAGANTVAAALVVIASY